MRQVLADDIKTVAENNDVSTEEIETMLLDYAAELKEEKPLGLKKLGIDEIAKRQRSRKLLRSADRY